MTQIEYDNVHKYLKAPSLAEIDAFIKELGITDAQFERYYEMPFRIMSKIRNGSKPFPKKYWHYVYEKIVPQYAVPYIRKLNSKVPTKVHPTLQKPKRVNVGRLKDLG